MQPRRQAALGPALAIVIALVGGTAPAAAADDGPVAAIDDRSADEARYHLPAEAGTALLVERGNDERAGRVDGQEYAFHFVAAGGPERFEVRAARGGTVIGSRSGVRGGRCREPLDGPRPRCWRAVNYVLVDHGDGTSGLYLHLRRGDPIVRRGDVVSAGQPIGFAGSSGWTDGVGLGFQVQRTPAWHEVGRGGWFLTESQPVSFAASGPTGVPASVPQTGDVVVSDSPEPRFEPFRLRTRPSTLPAAVPFVPGTEVEVDAAYEADDARGYGLAFVPSAEGASVRPLFGGSLAFAGCAGGSSAALGRTVIIERVVDGTTYLAVHGGLAGIAPELVDAPTVEAPTVDGPAVPPATIAPDEVIGSSGGSTGPAPGIECPGADPDAGLYVGLLRDAAVSPDGEVVGGTPVSPEPLVGELGYEGFAWWRGPVTAGDIDAAPGRPRARWNPRTPESGTHIPFGDRLTLRARVRDDSPISQVRFRAWYPRWPQTGSSSSLTAFDPASAWRQLALCVPPGGAEPDGASDCLWEGDALDAKVSFEWDPQAADGASATAPWLPRARRAITRDADACVPLSLAVEVIDEAGQVHSRIGRLPLPGACDDRRAEQRDGALVLYLDPLVPPRPPGTRGRVEDRGWPPVYAPDPLRGAVVWRDRSDNEDGFRIYARRSWLETDCSITDGPWQLIDSLPPNRERYRPRHREVVDSIEVPRIEGVPGSLLRWEYAVSAFNEAGETPRVPLGGFVGGSEAFCDPGLVPPPELEP